MMNDRDRANRERSRRLMAAHRIKIMADEMVPLTSVEKRAIRNLINLALGLKHGGDPAAAEKRASEIVSDPTTARDIGAF